MQSIVKAKHFARKSIADRVFDELKEKFSNMP